MESIEHPRRSMRATRGRHQSYQRRVSEKLEISPETPRTRRVYLSLGDFVDRNALVAAPLCRLCGIRSLALWPLDPFRAFRP